MLFQLKGQIPDSILAKDIIFQINGDIGVPSATFRAMEFYGSSITDFSMEEHMTLRNMAVEAGGKNGLIAAVQMTKDYLVARGSEPNDLFQSDGEASFYADYS